MSALQTAARHIEANAIKAGLAPEFDAVVIGAGVSGSTSSTDCANSG
jgi:glycerol-3-phosphate dehydrogenase